MVLYIHTQLIWQFKKKVLLCFVGISFNVYVKSPLYNYPLLKFYDHDSEPLTFY